MIFFMTPSVRKISRIILALALFIMAGWFLYAPALRAPFVFDDIDNIVNNPFIRLTHINTTELQAILKSPCPRPLANLTFAINYYVHQYDLFGYHLVNFAVHIMNAFLVFLIARLTLGLCGSQKTWMAPPIALLWLVNPVHTQSVTYIVQRMNAMAAMFVLLSLTCYILARRIQTHGGGKMPTVILMTAAGFSGLLSLLSKENAAVLPIIILLYEYFFFQDLKSIWLKKRFRWGAVAFIILAVIALVYLKGDPFEKILGMYEKKSFTPIQRLLTEPAVVIYYISLLLFPRPGRLVLDYDFPLATGFADPPFTAMAITALLMLAIAGVYMARKHRLFSFAILWFLVTLSIESSFIGLALIFEHRTYLPSVFPIIAAVHFAIRRIKPSLVGILIVMTTVVIWGYGTYQRNRAWADELGFWADAAAKAPRSPRVLNNLGMAYRQNGRIAAAEKAFRDALSYDPETKDALNNLGTILLDKGLTQEALSLFERAIAVEPGFYDAHYNRGLALMKLGQIVDAARAFQETIRLNPFSEKAHVNLGAALMRRLEVDKAISHFQRALELNPSFIEAYNNMGIAYYKKGLPNQALVWFNKALDNDAFHVAAYDNIKRIRFLSGEHEKEISRLRQNLSRQPDNPALYFRLAELSEKCGMQAQARDYYERTLALQPDAVESLNNLGNLYAAHYQDTQALALFRRLAAILPESPKIHYNLACLYARQGQPQDALGHLETAIQNGYDNWRQIVSDKDLENLRDTEYFKKIIIHHQGGKERQ